jgi:hypothetical protein
MQGPEGESERQIDVDEAELEVSAGTSAPADLLDFRKTVMAKTGLSDLSIGIVGDPSHRQSGGYHEGRSDLIAIDRYHPPADQNVGSTSEDYSVRLLRDRSGLTDHASAMDIGSDWSHGGRSAWLRFNNLLASQLKVNDANLAAIRAINYSPDGTAKRRIDRQNNWSLESSSDSVDGHTHIEWYRDTEGHRSNSLARLGQIIDAAVSDRPLPGTADIIWQNTNGQVHYWPMRDGKRQGGINIDNPVTSSWTLRGVGDVDGDGTDDIVWQNTNGQVHYWPMRDGKRQGGINIDNPVTSSWALRGVGDVNGDGTDDLVWQHTNGQVQYWPMRDGKRQGGISIDNPVTSSWALRGVGDVNGDGTDDIVWQHDNGHVQYWPMRDGKRQDGINIDNPVTSSWTLRGVGDVNGDGTDDIVWQHDNGQVHYWPMRDGKRQDGINIHAPVGDDWTLLGVGNVDSR